MDPVHGSMSSAATFRQRTAVLRRKLYVERKAAHDATNVSGGGAVLHSLSTPRRPPTAVSIDMWAPLSVTFIAWRGKRTTNKQTEQCCRWETTSNAEELEDDARPHFVRLAYFLEEGGGVFMTNTRMHIDHMLLPAMRDEG